MNVISTRLRGGETVIHVAANAAPEAAFELIARDLEDFYLARLAGTRREGATAAQTASIK